MTLPDDPFGSRLEHPRLPVSEDGLTSVVRRGKRRRRTALSATTAALVLPVALVVALTAGGSPSTDSLQVGEDPTGSPSPVTTVAPADEPASPEPTPSDQEDEAAAEASASPGGPEVSPAPTAASPTPEVRPQRVVDDSHTSDVSTKACAGGATQPDKVYVLCTEGGPDATQVRRGDVVHVVQKLCRGTDNHVGEDYAVRFGPQEQDAYVTTADGKSRVWQWSDDVVFTGAPYTDQLSAQECFSWSLTWRVDVPAGDYDVTPVLVYGDDSTRDEFLPTRITVTG